MLASGAQPPASVTNFFKARVAHTLLGSVTRSFFFERPRLFCQAVRCTFSAWIIYTEIYSTRILGWLRRPLFQLLISLAPMFHGCTQIHFVTDMFRGLQLTCLTQMCLFLTKFISISPYINIVLQLSS